MNSELTREELQAEIDLLEANIALPDEEDMAILAVSKRNLEFKREIAIRKLALRALDMEPKPIEECPINDGERYLLYSERGFERADYWTTAWAENHLKWETPFTHFATIPALTLKDK